MGDKVATATPDEYGEGGKQVIKDEVFHSQRAVAALPRPQTVTMTEDEWMPFRVESQTRWGGALDASDEPSVSWTSSNPEVAEVIVLASARPGCGTIVAKKHGETRLTYRAGSLYGLIDVTVLPGPAVAVRFLFGPAASKFLPMLQSERDVVVTHQDRVPDGSERDGQERAGG